jgi:hypothetical protein
MEFKNKEGQNGLLFEIWEDFLEDIGVRSIELEFLNIFFRLI